MQVFFAIPRNFLRPRKLCDLACSSHRSRQCFHLTSSFFEEEELRECGDTENKDNSHKEPDETHGPHHSAAHHHVVHHRVPPKVRELRLLECRSGARLSDG